MKKKSIKTLLGIGICFLCAAVIVVPALLSSDAESTQKIIVVDPGHGGEDGGAVGDDGSLEKDLNLQIALTLKEKLEACGYTVVMTRETDEDTDRLNGFHKKLDLTERVQTAESAKADLFLSVHINASTSARDQGFQVWYGTGNNNGKFLAEQIRSHVEEANVSSRIRVVKPVPETLYIFRTLQIPNVLIECGFISNAEDLYQLKQESFRAKLCEAIALGVTDYFSEKKEAIT